MAYLPSANYRKRPALGGLLPVTPTEGEGVFRHVHALCYGDPEGGVSSVVGSMITPSPDGSKAICTLSASF